MANIRDILETALKTRLDAASLSATVYKGFSSETKTGAVVVCHVREADEEPPMSGNYNATCVVETRAPFSFGIDEFDTLAAAVSASVMDADMPAELTTTNLTCWGFGSNFNKTWEVDEDYWVEKVEFVLYCAPITFSA